MGRLKSDGAVVSLNSYAHTGTYLLKSWSAVRAVQENSEVGDDRCHRLSRRRRCAVRHIVRDRVLALDHRQRRTRVCGEQARDHARIVAAGHDPVEQRNEKPALVEVGPLNHRDPVEVVVAKGLLRRYRQCRDVRSHCINPAERQFSGENRGNRRSLQAGES